MGKVRRLLRPEDLGMAWAIKEVTVPIGGGGVGVTFSKSDFGFDRAIECVVSVRIAGMDPDVTDVMEPVCPAVGTTLGAEVVGLTVGAGTGTTLTVMMLAMGE